MDEVRPRVKETTWQAFWLTTVEGLSTEEAARKLQITTAKLYVYKNRVLRMLRERALELRQGSDERQGDEP